MDESQVAFELIIATKNGWTTAKDSMGNYTKIEVAYAWVGWQEAWAYLKENPTALS
jgi:hypothetical protein